MNKKIINNNKGFGLLEVLISISVVIIGILPLINLFNSVLVREMETENKLKAIYFAQEGVEVVRQIRDTNWKNGDPWNEEPESEDPLSSSEWAITMDDCNAEKFKDFKLEPSDADNIKIYYANGKAFAQGSSCGGRTASGFTRTISVSEEEYDGTPNNEYMKVTSIVKFKGTELYRLTSYLNKWK